jgi:Cu(I)/Ag(I) efflux system membrane fusion protein
MRATRQLRGLIVPASIFGAIAVVALVYRGQLIGWFRGEGAGGPWSAPTRAAVGGMTIDASVQPDVPRTSGNRIRVELADESGAAIEGADVSVTYDMAAMGSMPEMKSTFPATSRGAGRYQTDAFDLPMAGTWGIIVDVERDGATATARYSLTIGTAGLQALGSEGGSAPPPPAISEQQYPSAALDALRRGLDLYDRVRSRLSEGTVDQGAARELAATIREASAALTDAPHEVMHAVEGAATAADLIAATSDVTAARSAFADASRSLVALAAADPRLAATWRVFECPMATGFQRWVQREPDPSNPYLGKEMSACVSAIDWSAAPEVASAPSDEITIDEARRAQIGITTDEVTRGPMSLDIRAVGRVTYDERHLTDVTLKVGGYITDLRVSATGQAVKKGQTLFTLYSPELYAAQQDLILSRKSKIDALAAASEKKLRLWGMSPAQIATVIDTGEPIEHVAFSSPASGFVIEKDVVEGGAVEAGMRLFRIASLDTIWVEAELYDADLAHVAKGTMADVALSYAPGATRQGKVTFLYPYLDPMTRTGRVRIELPNKGVALKPDMYATVTFHVALGERVQVPTAAIVYTGSRRIVFVDEGGGKLRAQEITVGVESGDLAEVLSGLDAGDVVVTSGNFLVAAESRLRSSSSLWKDAP